MKFVRPVLVVLGTCGLAAAAHAAEVRFGHLALQWPDGYTVVRPAEPVLLRGPRQQEVAGSVHLADAPSDQRTFARRSEHLMRSAAASHGRVVRTARATLPEGSTLVAVASQGRGAGRSYVLQFTVLARAGHVGYITVQGRGGDAGAEFRRLLPAFDTVRWVPLGAGGGSLLARD